MSLVLVDLELPEEDEHWLENIFEPSYVKSIRKPVEIREVGV